MKNVIICDAIIKISNVVQPMIVNTIIIIDVTLSCLIKK